MSKLNVNITDTKDLITQSKNLTNAQRKEAQIARLYINQCKMPVYSQGPSGNFVLFDNVGFNSKEMSDPAFITGIARAGVSAGLKKEDVLETYTSDSIAMALCNHIQKVTEKNYANLPAEQMSVVVDRMEKQMETFGMFARYAKVNLGVIVATEQQVKKDVERMKELSSKKEDEGLNQDK